MNPFIRSTSGPMTVMAAPWAVALGTVVFHATTASAIPPRSERVAARIVERASARQAIAEARAARAEARVAEITPLVPLTQPPRPATVRRLARTGVPLNGAPPLAGAPPLTGAPPLAPRAAARATTEPAAVATDSPAVRPSVPAAASPGSAADLADDGTRSVLTQAEAPQPHPQRAPAGPAVTHPPIELLPTPQPQ